MNEKEPVYGGVYRSATEVAVVTRRHHAAIVAGVLASESEVNNENIGWRVCRGQVGRCDADWKQEVGRLHITVNKSLVVQGSKRMHHLNCELNANSNWK